MKYIVSLCGLFVSLFSLVSCSENSFTQADKKSSPAGNNTAANEAVKSVAVERAEIGKTVTQEPLQSSGDSASGDSSSR